MSNDNEANVGQSDLINQARDVRDKLGLGRGWGADSYFSHSGGRVSLGQAREVWKTADDLAKKVLEHFGEKP